MLRRLMGLILIISVLMPLILGVAGVVIARQVASDMEAATTEPRQRIDERLENMRQTVREASQAFAGISDAVASISGALGAIGNAINALTTRITIPRIVIPDISFDFGWPLYRVNIPTPDIPAFSFDVPVLTQIRNVLEDIFSVFDDLREALEAIATISTIPEDLQGITTEMQTMLSQIAQVFGQWTTTLLIIGAGLVLWMGAFYLAMAYRWLSSGWNMLRGRPNT
mgnify:CR=1 FL=1